MTKETRPNKYNIEITFEDGNSFNATKLKSTYIGSGSFQDDIKISSNFIQITASRSSKINLDNIFYNHTSSMYIQILKSLIFYYLSSKKFVQIQDILIERYRNDKKLENKTIKASELTQVLSFDFKILENKIVKQKLKKLFDNDEKGEVILIASSYLAKASSIPDEIETFERLWKAFNKIYKFIGNHQNETNCQIALRTFILSNRSKFPLSINKVKKLTATNIRNKLRWRALILNDYETLNKTEAFHDFVLRYTDKRIMEVIKEILPYRKNNLVSQNLYDNVLDHINLNIQQNHIKDEEVVALLCIKYMYFVRNKLMHGEKLDSTFRLLPNKEIKELNWLNGILESLIIDLINCNDSF